MPRAAVLGRPVAHSLSPVMHRAGYAATGLVGWSYEAVDCGEAQLPAFVAGLGPEWVGLSLTMPLKEAAVSVAAEVTPTAARLGVANTLVRLPDGRWRADNTDAPGMVDALREGAPDVAVDRVVVLGAGGTARAALAATAELGASLVEVVARRPEAVTALLGAARALGVTVVHRPWSQAAAALGAADLAVSTVPAGVADPLAGEVRWRPGGVLLDVLYAPWPTPLATSAAAAGCRVVSGLDLLLAQGVRQFTLFTGVPAPVEAMRRALRSAAGTG